MNLQSMNPRRRGKLIAELAMMERNSLKSEYGGEWRRVSYRGAIRFDQPTSLVYLVCPGMAWVEMDELRFAVRSANLPLLAEATTECGHVGAMFIGAPYGVTVASLNCWLSEAKHRVEI